MHPSILLAGNLKSPVLIWLTCWWLLTHAIWITLSSYFVLENVILRTLAVVFKKKKKLFESKDDFTCFQHERNVKNAVNSTGKYMAFVKKLWKFSGFADRSIVVVQYNQYKGVVNFSDQQKWAISSVTTQWSLVPSWPFMLTCSSPSASKTEQRWNTALQVVSCNTW